MPIWLRTNRRRPRWLGWLWLSSITHEALTGRLAEMGVDPDAAMEPFIAPIDGFHDRTRPTGWLEGLVKAYVGDGIATDFYREISAYVDPWTQTLVRSVLQDVGQAEFAVKAIREAIEADPSVAGRLALWGRRLVGEALSQSQRVAVERDDLASLLVGGTNRPGADLAEMGRMFTRLTDEHIPADGAAWAERLRPEPVQIVGPSRFRSCRTPRSPSWLHRGRRSRSWPPERSRADPNRRPG